jgi:hypothetical protein
MSCAKCGRWGDGRYYEFFYGKIVEEQRPIGPIDGWAKYSTDNAKAFICNKCVSRRRKSGWREPLIAGSIALASVSILYFSFSTQLLASAKWLFWLPMLAVFGAIAFVPISIGAITYRILEYPDIGNKLAKETQGEEYKNLGYTLWTPKEFKKLKKTSF